jgi:hypothetical protein
VSSSDLSSLECNILRSSRAEYWVVNSYSLGVNICFGRSRELRGSGFGKGPNGGSTFARDASRASQDMFAFSCHEFILTGFEIAIEVGISESSQRTERRSGLGSMNMRLQIKDIGALPVPYFIAYQDIVVDSYMFGYWKFEEWDPKPNTRTVGMYLWVLVATLDRSLQSKLF